MDSLHEHEIFEMEILNRLNSGRLMEKMTFGGGTMLRLCHELNRYSADLDFWLIREVDQDQFLDKLDKLFKNDLEITDRAIKHYSIICEIRSIQYPWKLKIEIRKEIYPWEIENRIAYSPFSNRQVLVKAHTLKQTMANKIEALIDRGEIRDAFDIEFLLRKGIPFPLLPVELAMQIKKQVESFTELDFKVKLGSIIEADIRAYYIDHRFQYLLSKLDSVLH